jgi:hypothetical protein
MVITSIYALGTKVRFKDSGEEGLITEVAAQVDTGTEYAVDMTAWFGHDALELVALPTEESYAEVIRMHREEYCYDSDEAEDEEDEEDPRP